MEKLITMLSALIFGFLACNNTSTTTNSGLDHAQAQELVKKALNIPISFRHYIPPRKTICWGNDLMQFQNDGLITYQDDPNDIYGYSFKVDPMFAHMYLGQNAEGYHVFQFYKIVFNSIKGISIDPNTQLAIVRFSLHATDIGIFAQSLFKANTTVGCSGRPYIPFNLLAEINGELKFRKFDTGWQLESMQDKKPYDRLTAILNQNGR